MIRQTDKEYHDVFVRFFNKAKKNSKKKSVLRKSISQIIDENRADLKKLVRKSYCQVYFSPIDCDWFKRNHSSCLICLDRIEV